MNNYLRLMSRVRRSSFGSVFLKGLSNLCSAIITLGVLKLRCWRSTVRPLYSYGSLRNDEILSSLERNRYTFAKSSCKIYHRTTKPGHLMYLAPWREYTRIYLNSWQYKSATRTERDISGWLPVGTISSPAYWHYFGQGNRHISG